MWGEQFSRVAAISQEENMETHETKANLLSHFSSSKCQAQLLKRSHFSFYAYSQNEVIFIYQDSLESICLSTGKKNDGIQLAFPVA